MGEKQDHVYIQGGLSRHGSSQARGIIAFVKDSTKNGGMELFFVNQ